MKTKIDKDLLANCDRAAGGRAAMEVVTALQKHDPHVQVVGLAAAFKLLTEETKLHVGDVLTYTGNLMNDAEGRRPEFKAVSEYIKNEL